MTRFATGAAITDALAARDAHDRVRVVRALLMRPVLSVDGDTDLFRAARRHSDELRAWFDRETGWRLVVGSQTVRLMTSYVPSGPTAETVAARHAARGRRSDPPFTRRRYVLLCLLLAVLERADPQVALGQLADEVVLAARQPGLEAVEFTLGRRDERSDMVAAIRLLLGYGVLMRVAGDEDSYVSADGDALYDIDRRVLSTILSTVHAPGIVAGSLGDTPEIGDIEEALHRPPPIYTDGETNRQLRHRVSRRLLCDPVVYYDELPEAERNYLVSQRVPLTRRLAEGAGLVPELRAEGIALADPDDALTDVRMPDQGTDGHATLLLAEYLTATGRATVGDLRGQVRALAATYHAYWRKTVREVGAENPLVDEALNRLVGLGLVRCVGTGTDAVVTPLPALHRFAVASPVIRGREAR
ncbi:TIGR02678 family protein [Gordonia sp. HY002]|uniref:TIGR02678 family protein n=1 Tax=Gordonia zhenghanii TaxID=2911516 RepID=UPI001EEF7EBE|nr:TIGR02678 family protein [Gordonia zhenghanii]MCF8571237.1 TIGR02678 family protein [Gordonia zhenghanii]MCF8601761.1 TIGR02678 family protein [Gordonia zhenghanii]